MKENVAYVTPSFVRWDNSFMTWEHPTENGPRPWDPATHKLIAGQHEGLGLNPIWILTGEDAATII